MIRNSKTQFDIRNKVVPIIMDLSKAFDTLNHNLKKTYKN